MSDWPAGRHLASLYDGLYLSLAQAAPRASLDGVVVRLHESSRAFGALALELRRNDENVAPDALVTSVIENSLDHDETGSLTLYALSMVIGPRLLVSLRDYLEDESDGSRRVVLSHGSDVVIGEIRAVGVTMAREVPRDDAPWATAARAIVDTFDEAGMAESLGQQH